MRENVIEFLIDNQDYFKKKYSSLFSKKNDLKKKEPRVFHDDIDEQLKSSIIAQMSDEISVATGADMETIMIVLEDMNMEEFFK